MTLKDNLERACELVYEFYTGKCWHKLKRIPDGTPMCNKCGSSRSFQVMLANPPLATSLDAWRPIWEGMSDEQWKRFAIEKLNVCISHSCRRGLHPLHHLEAALRAAEVECDMCCDWCGGDAYESRHDCYDSNPCTCTNGRISLYTKLEREHDMNEDAKYQARLVAEDR